MKQVLILFAKGFPYNVSEPFLENEYPLYHGHFDKVLIVTGCKKGEKPTRTVTDPLIEIIDDHTLSRDFRSVAEALPYVLTDRMFYREIASLLKKRQFSIKRLYQLIVISCCGNHRALLAKKWLKAHRDYEVNIIYSYWFQATAYAAIRLKQMMKNDSLYTVTRAHGFDLYEERISSNYLPYHEQIYRNVDEVAAISDNGKRYLEGKYGDLQKISIHHLGALDQGKHNPNAPRDVFRIVSCSRTVQVKRIHRIVDALAQIRDIQIEWVHIGGGELFNDLKLWIKKLPGNIKVTLTDSIPNTQVYEYYASTPFHCFANVSYSEGVPVSVMEALSFDIPVIATAVGGTAELVDDRMNGFLLDRDFTDDQFVSCIRQMAQMPERDYLSFRNAARDKFEREYNAIPNYKAFIDKIAQKGKKQQ